MSEPPNPEPDMDLVKVYETGNAAIIPVYESLLNDAGIEYLAKGEGIQDLFGWGRFGTNLNYAIGPVEFYVRADFADEARQLADTLQAPAADVPEQPDQPDQPDPPDQPE